MNNKSSSPSGEIPSSKESPRSRQQRLRKQRSLCSPLGPRPVPGGSLRVPSASFDIPTLTLTVNPLEKNEVTIDMSSDDDDEGSSIGSASSLLNAPGDGPPTATQEEEQPEEGGALALPSSSGDLGIRRVSEISHINELRREVSGLDHLASEFYEISRQPNPDSISLDSIHKKVLMRCQNKYIPPTKSSAGNKCFVLLTGTITVLGIVYGFWYKNFGGYRPHL